MELRQFSAQNVAVSRRRLFLNPPPLAGEVARSGAPEGATETLIHREKTRSEQYRA